MVGSGGSQLRIVIVLINRCSPERSCSAGLPHLLSGLVTKVDYAGGAECGMARRGTNAQAAHDKAIEELIHEYRDEGWRVWADIDGWPTPNAIGGHRPDILGRDGDARVVVEVETDPEDDDAQHDAFRTEADADPDTQFHGYVVDFEGEISDRFS